MKAARKATPEVVLGPIGQEYSRKLETQREFVEHEHMAIPIAQAAYESALSDAARGLLPTADVAATKAAVDVARASCELAEKTLAGDEWLWANPEFRKQLKKAEADAVLAASEPKSGADEFSKVAAALVAVITTHKSEVATRADASSRVTAFCKQHGLPDVGCGRPQPDCRGFAAAFQQALRDAGLSRRAQTEDWLGLRPR